MRGTIKFIKKILNTYDKYNRFEVGCNKSINYKKLLKQFIINIIKERKDYWTQS